MNEPTMLYRCPGPETFEGVQCETTTVDAPDVEARMAEGWHRNWIEAGQAVKDAADQLKANEDEQAEIAKKLAAAGSTLKAVHKGRGVWEVQDADGKVVQAGLTKEAALAAAGG